MDDSFIEEGIESGAEFIESDMEYSQSSEVIDNNIQEDSDAPGESIDSPSAPESEEGEDYQPDFSAEINFPDEMINGEDNDIEEGIEEGEEVPDESEPSEIVQNDELSGAEQVRSETPNVDYSVQLAQIYEKLEGLQGDVTLDDINENIISIDSNIEMLHRDMVALDRNNRFHSRLEIGLLVAIWGSLIIYFAFSKIF